MYEAHRPVQAKLGIGLGTQPGYCSTCITGVTWHSSAVLAASTALVFENLGSMHVVPSKIINSTTMV